MTTNNQKGMTKGKINVSILRPPFHDVINSGVLFSDESNLDPLFKLNKAHITNILYSL